MRQPFLSFLAALRFLTILPLSWQSGEDGPNFAGGLFFFPLIGLGIGGLCLVSAALLGHILPQSLVTLAGIVVLAFISGCLHIDGLADTADGLLSSRGREEKLVIMRDSRTGAMGVVAIVFVLGGKYAALSSLTPILFLPALLLMPLAGRCAIVLSMAILPYAREEGGSGQLFYSPDTIRAAWLSSASFLALLGLAGAFSLCPWQTVVYLGIVLPATIFLFAGWCRRSLGGATGDTLGAVCELAELMVALVFNVHIF
jgi:adenosylcobinamide-GDP ribazoletransferase